jgi:uncharacterized protein (UPF0333 family)
MKTNKGFVPLLIIIIVAMVAGGGIYYYSKQEVKTTEPEVTTPTNTQATTTASSSATDAKDWKTYTNSKYGFSFNYPEKFEIKNDGPTGFKYGDITMSYQVVLQPRVSTDKAKLSVYISENANVDLNVTSTAPNKFSPSRDITKIKIGKGTNAINANMYDGGYEGDCGKIVEFKYNNNFFVVGFGDIYTGTDLDAKLFCKDTASINTILESFTFNGKN